MGTKIHLVALTSFGLIIIPTRQVALSGSRDGESIWKHPAVKASGGPLGREYLWVGKRVLAV
jgi:hypothetical protein